ncbi:MAG: hypothetical protein MUF28_01950 [Ignavibacterium sp.]|jgi:hypothetical protein|nr:hypothetical protein [Ignavibacterium sp.]
MNSNNSQINNTKRIFIGISFIVFPLIFIFAFATHPNLLKPHFLGSIELIQRAHNNSLLHFGHALVTLCTGLLVVVAIHFMNVLKNTRSEWLGFIGSVLAIFGALMLAADKGAYCLTMSALDNLPEDKFINIMPGLIAIFGKGGWLILTWGIVLLTVGFFIQAVGLLRSKSLATWQGIFFLIGVLFIGTPDGVEIINLTSAILIAVAFVPYGIKLIINKTFINT